MAILLGCIADDFTGATDLAGMLVKAGFRTIQTIGVPAAPLPGDVDAVVVALKSRTCPAGEAVRASLAALAALQAAGAEQIYFKYCSTFDSTPAGNIGPVADALLDALGADFTVVCPAFPTNGRTIYKGHLFVGDVPLAESGMRDHPLTPMRDSSLVRLMQAQTGRKVGRIPYEDIRRGPAAIGGRIAALRAEGIAYAVADALVNEDLLALGAACTGLKLVTAGSGLALGLGPNFRTRLLAEGAAETLPRTGGRRAVISGSCSAATRAQVVCMQARHPSLKIGPADIAAGRDVVGQALAWARAQPDGPVLIYATADPEEVRAAQEAFGPDRAGTMVEQTLAAIATGLVGGGVGQLIVAGGETAGAVVQALGITALAIGPEIDPGVPWTATVAGRGGPPLALALKSGNFGTEEFFLKAWDRLPG